MQHAKNLGDIRAAFRAITGFNCARLDVFRRDPTQRTTSAELRQLRKDLADALEENRKAYAAFIQSKESAERAFQAVDCATDEDSRAAVQSLRPALARKYEEASAALEGSRARSREVQSKLDRQEAWFAQSQLGNFIDSGRREFTPLNIAMGMAGLPYVSARVSCERCSALKPRVEHGHTFRMFKAVEAVVARSPQDKDKSITNMRAYLLDPQNKKQPYIAELRTNWYFLESAIRSVGQALKTPVGAVPFRIFAEYQRRVECQSQVDVLLAQDNHL